MNIPQSIPLQKTIFPENLEKQRPEWSFLFFKMLAIILELGYNIPEDGDCFGEDSEV